MSELKTKKPTVKYILQSYGTILALALIIILFSIISPTSFFTLTNFINITRQITGYDFTWCNAGYEYQ